MLFLVQQIKMDCIKVILHPQKVDIFEAYVYLYDL
jgi:hypothetical protein